MTAKPGHSRRCRECSASSWEGASAGRVCLKIFHCQANSLEK